MSKTALITGGAGFLGSHLCERFLKEGYRVICMDNLITGRLSNISQLEKDPNFEFINHDVSKYIDIDGEIDIVLHFASPASPVDYLNYPIQTLKVGSLGTHNALGVAKNKKAKFLLASTSEIYGDPKVHPQPETYYGHVNCVGPRGVYDEAKRFAEAITMAYHKTHKIDTKMVRIFNSILANERIIVFNDKKIHIETIEKYVDSKSKKRMTIDEKIYVPAFNPSNCKMKLYKVDTVIKHPCNTDCYEIALRYGRKVKVTGDHSVFTKGINGKPVATPVRNLKVRDYVAIPSKLPVVEQDFAEFSIAGSLIKYCREKALWDYLIISPALKNIINNRREDINRFLLNSKKFNAKKMRNAIMCSSNKYKHTNSLPLWIIKNLDIKIPKDSKIRIYTGGAHIVTPDYIKITNDILWLIGFYLAEGCSNYTKGKNYYLTFSSDSYLLDKAKKILEKNFGVHVIKTLHQKNRAPAIFTHSKILYFIFKDIFKVIGMNGFPSWVLQLPLKRVKYLLEGFKDGDGTHSGKKVGNELCFETVSKKMLDDLTFLLLRFGIIASVGKYSTTFKKKYGFKKFPFYRATICEISTFNILKWDRGVKQRLNAIRCGDLVWSMLKSVKKCKPTKYVYDFSVPKAENFIAGNGVSCHNTYGPRMRKQDGRAIPNFISQALKNEPITVYGKGDQTRSFCFVSDLIEGLYLLSQSDIHEPVNIGNPKEFTVMELAKIILKLTKSKSKIVYKPLPTDDPKVRQPDISKAKKLLKWKPSIELEEGLRETIEWFKR